MFVPDDASTYMFLYFYKNVGTEVVRSYLIVIENILNKNTTKTDACEIWYQVFWNVIGTNTKAFCITL